MKITVVGCMVMMGLLFAGQAPAELITAIGSYTGSLSVKMGRSEMSAGSEGINETSSVMEGKGFFGGDTASEEQFWSSMSDQKDKVYGTFYGLYGSYSTIATYRHITLLRGTNATDRAGITLYSVADGIELPEEPAGRFGDFGFAGMGNSILFEGFFGGDIAGPSR